MRRHLETQHGEEKTSADLYPVPAHSHVIGGDFTSGHSVIVA